jgi:hypothetical protein
MRAPSIDGALGWPDFKPTWPSQWNRDDLVAVVLSLTFQHEMGRSAD